MPLNEADLVLGETTVVRLGAHKVALSACYKATREGREFPAALLSIVEVGSSAGPRDQEVTVGATLALGALTYTVVDISLPEPGRDGTVRLRPL